MDLTINQSIENIRKKLLDLSNKNSLINFHYGKKNALRLVTGDADKLSQLLLSNQTIIIQAIPEPSEEQLLLDHLEDSAAEGIVIVKKPPAIEWAQHLNISVDYDWTRNKGSSSVLSLYYPRELDGLLRHIASRADSNIEETGTNILYAAFGFLEWYESQNSNKKRLAPLFLIPVRLQRARINKITNTYEYEISYTDEEVATNISLREKLRVEFGLYLPEIENEEAPSEYMNRLSALLITQPRWKIHSHITVSFFSFGKLLMYLDLDQKKWPIDNSISNHPIVSQFLVNKIATTEKNEYFSEDYAIDDIKEDHYLYPLIYDADSSQHSAVIDAINGKNLVIEGPPGTGKSQTITNIIAAALAQNKKVLFVAEKLAALDVVKRRLDGAGLGLFCLELHGRKIQKQQLFHAIGKRLEFKQAYKKSELDIHISLFEDAKRKLQAYALLVAKPYKDTGKTIYQILGSASYYRSKVKASSLIHDSIAISTDGFGSLEWRKVEEQIKIFREHCQRILSIANIERIELHPWYGIGNIMLHSYDSPKVIEVLKNCLVGAENLKNLASFLDASISIKFLREFIAFIKNIPELPDASFFSFIPKFNLIKINQSKKNLNLLKEIQQRISKIDLIFKIDRLSDESISIISQCIVDLRLIEVDDDLLVEDLYRKKQETDFIIEKIYSIKNNYFFEGNLIGEYFSYTFQGLSDFCFIISLTQEVSFEALKCRDSIFENDDLDAILGSIKEDIDRLNCLQQKISEFIKFEAIFSIAELETIKNDLNKSIFSIDKWRAKKKFGTLLKDKNKVSNKQYFSMFDDILGFLMEKSKFENNEIYTSALGSFFMGIKTPWIIYGKTRKWYKRIREHFGGGFHQRGALGKRISSFRLDLFENFRDLNKGSIIEELMDILKKLDYFVPNLNKSDTLLTDIDYLSLLQDNINKFFDVSADLIVSRKFKIKDVSEACDIYKELKESINQFSMGDLIFEIIDFPNAFTSKWFNAHNYEISQINILLDLANYFLSAPDSLKRLIEEFYLNPLADKLNLLKGKAVIIEIALRDYLEKYYTCKNILMVNEELWFSNKNSDSLEDIINRTNFSLEFPQWLGVWLDYNRVTHQLKLDGFEKFVILVEKQILPVAMIEDALQLCIYDFLAREIISTHADISQFSGETHSTIRVKFKEYDDKIKSLQKARISNHLTKNSVPQGNHGGRVGSYTELSLLQHEIAKKTRHIPIRKLIENSSQALQALMPCFMLSPISVAQFLPPGRLDFDIVIMDEASQLRPEESLGVIARGKQVIIVGDPKQLPPTNFFNKFIAENDEEDLTSVENSESILDVASPLFNPSRRLRWHYRSQHESLIAYSNREFYGNLVVFPSPYARDSGYGIKYHHIEDGCFVNLCNLKEAEAIVNAIIDHFYKNPHETL